MKTHENTTGEAEMYKFRKGMMNKKGIFYSMSVVLFIVLLIIVFSNKSDIFQKDEKFHMERAQIIVMDHFVRDFDRYYTESIIKAAAKPALINLTKGAPFSRETVVNLMIDGSEGGIKINPLLSTKEGLNQSLRTLTFNLDAQSFNYSLQSIEQPDYKTIMLNFEVDYYFKVLDTNWSRKSLPVSITLDVHGMSHPGHSASGVIDSSWVSDSSGCYANIIFSDNPIICSGNIRPPPMCDDGNIDIGLGEECEPPNVGNCDAYCHIIV
jgi:hypothetical protein